MSVPACRDGDNEARGSETATYGYREHPGGRVAVFCLEVSVARAAGHISDLKPDPKNARKHNPRNVGMVEHSIQRDGFGRSILVANDGTIIAGNATIEAAAAAGIENVVVVESDGRSVIAVKRTDVEPGSPEFHKLALSDNRAAELAEWDADVLAALAEDGVDLDQFWFEDELARLLERPGDDDWADAFGALPDGEKSPFQQMTFTVSDEQAGQVGAALKAAKAFGPFVDTGNENSNGNALARICETFLTEHGQ